MASFTWIKLYQELLSDPKVGRLSDSAFRRFIELQLLAGEQPVRDGRLPADVHDIAWRLRITDDQLAADLGELEAAGLIESQDGRRALPGFADQQGAVSGAARMRALRQRQQRSTYQESQEHAGGRAVSIGPDAEAAGASATSAAQRSRDVSDARAPHTSESCNRVVTALVQGRNGAVTNRHQDQEEEQDREGEISPQPPSSPHGRGSEPGAAPPPVANDALLWPIIAALAEISSQVYTVTRHEEYADAAVTLLGWEAAPEQVRQFPGYWAKHGWHRDRPALKTILDEWRKYQAWLSAPTRLTAEEAWQQLEAAQRRCGTTSPFSVWGLDERTLAAARGLGKGTLAGLSQSNREELRNRFRALYETQLEEAAA